MAAKRTTKSDSDNFDLDAAFFDAEREKHVVAEAVTRSA
jgi:hypothetical protein